MRIQFPCIETVTCHGCKEDEVAEDIYISILSIATDPFRYTGAQDLCIIEKWHGNFAPEYAGSLHGISHCTCDISPAPQLPQPPDCFDSMLLRSQEFSLTHMASDTRGTLPPRGETVRSVLLVMASQMCLLLISHSQTTHFCLFIGSLLSETMEGH